MQMKFTLARSIEVLEKTAPSLDSLLGELSEDWLRRNEGENTWSPYTILGHLIFGEKTDWIVRIKLILSDTEEKYFVPFDRFAQFEDDQNRAVSELLEEFAALRSHNIRILRSLNITSADLVRRGIHPEFGEVSLAQLIAAWVVHDLGHIGQITRVMAKQYRAEVGPWAQYLGILGK